MNAIYTVCTYNHIGRALSLAESIENNCIGTKFIICLVDTVRDDFIPAGIELIMADDMKLPFLKEMCSKYSPLELNSALKAYFANYIFEKYKSVNHLIFLDSDILLFSDLTPVYKALKFNSIVITPHSLSPVPGGSDFDDRNFLRSGLYNAGFFGLKRDQYTQAFLNWWMIKLRNQGFFDPKRGMFAEQLWMNLIPLYFENVHVLRHLGCNVAHWNMHERILSNKDGIYYVNKTCLLIFFHFSGANMSCIKDNIVSVHQKRYTFVNRPDVLPIFRKYINSLKKHSFEKYNQIYTLNSSVKTQSKAIKSIAELYKKIIKRIFVSNSN